VHEGVREVLLVPGVRQEDTTRPGGKPGEERPLEPALRVLARGLGPRVLEIEKVVNLRPIDTRAGDIPVEAEAVDGGILRETGAVDDDSVLAPKVPWPKFRKDRAELLGALDVLLNRAEALLRPVLAVV